MTDFRVSLCLSLCRLLDGAVDRLSKQIRALTNLTLHVTSTQPLSATSRHTAPFYPLPHPLAGAGGAAGVGRIPRCLEPTELLLQLEGSGMNCWSRESHDSPAVLEMLFVMIASAVSCFDNLALAASCVYG